MFFYKEKENDRIGNIKSGRHKKNRAIIYRHNDDKHNNLFFTHRKKKHGGNYFSVWVVVDSSGVVDSGVGLAVV